MQKFKLYIAIALSLLMASVTMASAQEYSRYCNPRYGFCLNYPASLSMNPPPENGDGISLYDNHDFTLTASGINNVMNGTLESEMIAQKNDLDRVTYSTVGKNWYALSGIKDDHIIYMKTYAGKGSYNHLYIEYPANLKAEYDKVVILVSKSFVPGRIDTLN